MTKDVCYFVLDPVTGAVSKELWFEWPFVGFMHDCAMSEFEGGAQNEGWSS